MACAEGLTFRIVSHAAIRPSILQVSGDLRVHAHYLSWPRRKASITRTVLELGEPAAVFPCCIAAGCSPETETSARRIPFLYFQQSGVLNGTQQNVEMGKEDAQIAETKEFN